jgi:hypothetical protein
MIVEGRVMEFRTVFGKFPIIKIPEDFFPFSTSRMEIDISRFSAKDGMEIVQRRPLNNPIPIPIFTL